MSDIFIILIKKYIFLVSVLVVICRHLLKTDTDSTTSSRPPMKSYLYNHIIGYPPDHFIIYQLRPARRLIIT